jgi:branched-subunit amino acid transport protein
VNIWLVLLGIGAITFATRLSFILSSNRLRVIPWIQRALRFVPPAVLSAIIFPELLIREGMIDLSLGNERLIAGALAMLVAWRTRNVLLTIGAGMAALWLFIFL